MNIEDASDKYLTRVQFDYFKIGLSSTKKVSTMTSMMITASELLVTEKHSCSF